MIFGPVLFKKSVRYKHYLIVLNNGINNALVQYTVNINRINNNMRILG